MGLGWAGTGKLIPMGNVHQNREMHMTCMKDVPWGLGHTKTAHALMHKCYTKRLIFCSLRNVK